MSLIIGNIQSPAEQTRFLEWIEGERASMMSVDLRRESHWNNLPPHQLCRLREIFAHGISRAQYQDISEEFRDKQLSRDWANTNKKLSNKRLFYWIQLEFLSIIRVRVVNLSHQTCGGSSISDKHSICLHFRLFDEFHPRPCASSRFSKFTVKACEWTSRVAENSFNIFHS